MEKPKFHKDTFCPLRWAYPLVDFSKSEVRTCCRTRGQKVTSEEMEKLGTEVFLNSQFQKERRLEMLKGIRHEACDACWMTEEAGMQSLRTANPWLPDPWRTKEKNQKMIPESGNVTVLRNILTNEELIPEEATIDSSILRSDHPYMLEVNLSNTCDLKCSYCSPFFSSKWETELELYALGTGYRNYSHSVEATLQKEKKKNVDERFLNLFWEWFRKDPIRSLNRIGIIGGEPLINPALPDFLEKLIASYRAIPFEDRPNSGYSHPDRSPRIDHKPVIWFVTNLNCSTKVMDRFIGELLPDLLETFHVEIHASSESVGERNEYIRYGLNWDLYKENLERLCALKHPHLSIGLQMALNSLSITTLTDYLRYAKELHDRFEIPIMLKQNIVSFPEAQNPAVLTPDFADYIDDALEFLRGIKDQMRSVDDDLGGWPLYYDYLKAIRETIKSQQGAKVPWKMGNLDDVRANFFEFFLRYDELRGTNFLKTFPEHEEFYRHCRKLWFEREVKRNKNINEK